MNIADKWGVVVAYDITLGDADDIASWLDALGCGDAAIRRAIRTALSINSGFTFSNPDLRMSLLCVSNATGADQWWDTMVHELKHVQSHICDHYGVPEDTEDAAYLIGFLMREVWRSTHQTTR